MQQSLCKNKNHESSCTCQYISLPFSVVQLGTRWLQTRFQSHANFIADPWSQFSVSSKKTPLLNFQYQIEIQCGISCKIKIHLFFGNFLVFLQFSDMACFLKFCTFPNIQSKNKIIILTYLKIYGIMIMKVLFSDKVLIFYLIYYKPQEVYIALLNQAIVDLVISQVHLVQVYTLASMLISVLETPFQKILPILLRMMQEL